MAGIAPAEAGLFNNIEFVAARKADERGDYVTARRKFEALLDSPDPAIRAISAFTLHEYYIEGKGVARDNARGLSYLRTVADSPDRPWARSANWRLGHYYELGLPGALDIDRRQAILHYRKAAELGDETAAKSIRALERFPDAYVAAYPSAFSAPPADDIAPGGMKQAVARLDAGDIPGATRILEWHARRGDAQAQHMLAMLLNTDAAPDAQSRAKGWMYLSARNGHADGQRTYAMILYKLGLIEEPRLWLSRSAAQGDSDAENLLGVLEVNPGGDVAPDYAKAIAHFSRAIEMGNIKAFSNLADLYDGGMGVPKDAERAKALYRQGAEAGDELSKTRLFTKYDIVLGPHRRLASSASSATQPAPAAQSTAMRAPPIITPIAPPPAAPSPSAVDLYATLSPSVHEIIALGPRSKDVLQGSAVAISANEAVTNCHVVKNSIAIGTSINGEIVRLRPGRRNERVDLCTIYSDGLFVPIRRTRSFADLKVGERVYAVGSPEGLSNTISEGIISGLRSDNGIHYIQTNAAISHGSSGGGLFDGEGRLIGITTFALKNADSLNFAVSIEELH